MMAMHDGDPCTQSIVENLGQAAANELRVWNVKYSVLFSSDRVATPY